MERHHWEWFLLLLWLTSSLGQEDQAPATPDPTATVAAPDSNDDNPDPEWAYVEFLQDNISDKVERILSVTLVNANEYDGLDQTVEDALRDVMLIREELLSQIRELRKDGIAEDGRIRAEEKLSEFRMDVMTILLSLVDEEAANAVNLKEISRLLLALKQKLSNEVMRILMLPPPTGKIPTPTSDDCEGCEIYTLMRENLTDITDCSGAGNCDLPPNMWFMYLIRVTDLIDEEIKKLYNQLIGTTEDIQRQLYRDLLDTLKQIRDGDGGREGIDEIISKMIGAGEDEKDLKSLINSNLKRIVDDLSRREEECMEKCSTCNDCLVIKLKETIEKMKTFDSNIVNSLYGEQSEKERVRQQVREEMIEYINENNGIYLRVLTLKAEGNDVDSCEDRWSGWFKNTLKVPMWMLVNTTIFAEYSEIELTIKQSIVLLEEMLTDPEVNECSSTPRPPPPPENCEWNEYEQTKLYLERVDQTIQESLFKNGQASRVGALLAFVELQGMMDNRVKELYEDQTVLHCPNEIPFIKKKYMHTLGDCMQEFMDTNEEGFGKLTRLRRISCTKRLRSMMEQRMADLLTFEINTNLMSTPPPSYPTPPTSNY
jgi:hypothetical protein